MPSKTDEECRRTDVSRFDPAEYAELEHDLAQVTHHEPLPAGGILESLPAAAKAHADLVSPHLFSLFKPRRDRFTALHAAFFTCGNFLYVSGVVVLEEPLRAARLSIASG